MFIFTLSNKKNKDKVDVAIIDPVGIKAGMDYYDINLTQSLLKQKINTIILSNYTTSLSLKCFSSTKKKSVFEKVGFYFMGVVLSVYYLIKKKCKFVIIHLFSFEVKDFLLLFLVKIVFRKTLVIVHDVSGFKKSDSKIIKKLILNLLSNQIIVHNQFSKEEIKASLSDRSIRKLKVIPHGGYSSLPTEISRKEARSILGLDENRKYLLFFGQIKRVKGLDILLKSMADVDQETKLIVAGRVWEDDFSTYEKIIRDDRLHDRIILKLDYINDYTRDLLFKSADLLVIPYKKIYQSGVLLMSMSYGLPVIASDLPANEEVITSWHDGILFKSNDVIDLAKNINKALNDKILLNRLKINSMDTINKCYNWDKISESYLEVIKSVE